MTHTVIYDNGRKKFNRWNYIVCQADKFHKLIKVNDLAESEEYTPVTYTQKSVLTSSLIIEDKTTNFNYGFSFVRELKLFSSYNFDFWDESHHNIKKEHFDFLLHYFHNDFSQLKLSEAKITDQVGGLVTKLTVKPGRVGYNYVIDYDYLVICEEGYVYMISVMMIVVLIILLIHTLNNVEDAILLVILASEKNMTIAYLVPEFIII